MFIRQSIKIISLKSLFNPIKIKSSKKIFDFMKMMTQSSNVFYSSALAFDNYAVAAASRSAVNWPLRGPSTSLYEYHQHSPTTLTPPHEYNFVPVYKAPKFFDEFDKYGFILSPASSTSSLPSPKHQSYGSMQLPLTPPLSTTPPASVTPPSVFRSAMPIAKPTAIFGTAQVNHSSNFNADTQRTRSVIMKIEDQRIVEVSPKDLNGRSSSENEEEITCKWRECYR